MFAPVPGAMFVNGDPPALHVRLVHKRTEFDVHVDPNATFGELRYEAKASTGLPMDAFNLLFRGRPQQDSGSLVLAGLKNGSMVVVQETAAYQDQVRATLAGLKRAKQSQQPGPTASAHAGGHSGPAAAAWNPSFPPSGAAGTPPGVAPQHRQQQSSAQVRERFDPSFPPPKPPADAAPGATTQQPPRLSPQRQQPISPQPMPVRQARSVPIGPQPAPQQAPPTHPAESLQQQLVGKVDAVQKELDSLASQVDELTPGGEANNAGQAGASAAHKQSLLLLELLTRVMLTLDGVRAPDGGETPAAVRAARKAAVVRAQRLIDRVEACKAAAAA